MSQVMVKRCDFGRVSGVCWNGCRKHALKLYGIDPQRFRGEGVPVEELEALSDPYAQRVATVARERVAKEAGNG